MATFSSHLLNSVNGTHASGVKVTINQINSSGIKKIFLEITNTHNNTNFWQHNETHEKHTPRLVPRCLRWRRALSAALRLPCLKQSSLGIGCRRGFPGFGLLKFYNMFNFVPRQTAPKHLDVVACALLCVELKPCRLHEALLSRANCRICKRVLMSLMKVVIE